VLVDSRAVVEDIWRRWATARGLDPAPYLRLAHGRRIRETLVAVDPTLDIEREVQWLDATEAADATPMTAIPGARELVRELAPDRWAIVTSGGYGLATRRLDRAGLPRPAVFITAGDVERGKPDPQGYLLAAERLGRAAAACIVFEDAPPGIAAARAAGARVIALTTTHAADALRDAAATIGDFRSLRVDRDRAGLVVRFDP
jgi:mannitol-1-/sugar-/sorbitol-6-phosphatase